MTASTEPRGGLEYGWDPGEDGWGPPMNANLLRLSRVGFHPSVVSKSTTAPPGSPVSGEGYIVPSGATGAWSGQSGKIAIWDGAAWAYIAPRDGFLVHVADADGLALYDGGAWSADVLRADRLATAYAHSQAGGNPHGTTAAQVGALAADNPDFAGALKQGGVTRITSGGGAWLTSMQSANLAGAGDRPVAADLAGTLQPKTPDQFRNMIFALASSLKGAANGVAELGADGKVPSAQLPTSTLPTDPVFDTVTTTGAAYIGTNLDVTGNAVVDGWASIAGSLTAADARFTNLSHTLGSTATQLPGADESGNLVASGVSTTAGSTGTMLVRKYQMFIGPLGYSDYGVSTGGGLFVSSETAAVTPILAIGHGTESVAIIADVRFCQVVAAGKTGIAPALKAQMRVESIGSGGSVGGYGSRITFRARADNANDLSDVFALEAGLALSKAPFRTDSACYSKAAIRTATTTTAANNHVVIFDGMGDRTETLPPATGSNRVLVMKNRSGAYSWTLDGDGSETIDGAATLVLTANQCATLIDYTTGQWAVIGKVA